MRAGARQSKLALKTPSAVCHGYLDCVPRHTCKIDCGTGSSIVCSYVSRLYGLIDHRQSAESFTFRSRIFVFYSVFGRSIRANQHAETLQAQYHLLQQQRDELVAKLNTADDRDHKNQASLTNLQCALEQFQISEYTNIL